MTADDFIIGKWFYLENINSKYYVKPKSIYNNEINGEYISYSCKDKNWFNLSKFFLSEINRSSIREVDISEIKDFLPIYNKKNLI